MKRTPECQKVYNEIIGKKTKRDTGDIYKLTVRIPRKMWLEHRERIIKEYGNTTNWILTKLHDEVKENEL